MFTLSLFYCTWLLKQKRRIKKDGQLKLGISISCFQVTQPAVCSLSYTTPDCNANETRWVSLCAFWHVVAYCLYSHSIFYQTCQGWSPAFRASRREVWWYQNIWRSRAWLWHACTVLPHHDDTSICHTYTMIIYRRRKKLDNTKNMVILWAVWKRRRWFSLRW